MTRRPATTDKLKLRSAILWGKIMCMWPGCGMEFNSLSEIEWDHRTALALGGKHEYWNIIPLCVKCHKQKTFGKKATTLNSDIHTIAKVKRIRKGGKVRKGPPIKSRGFSKQHRPMVRR